MTDCATTNDCAIPLMWQYVLLVAVFAMFALDCYLRGTKDPYDRR